MIDCRPRRQRYDGVIPSPLGEPRGDMIATPLPVVYQDAPAEELSGGSLLIALLFSVMISVAVSMVMPPRKI